MGCGASSHYVAEDEVPAEAKQPFRPSPVGGTGPVLDYSSKKYPSRPAVLDIGALAYREQAQKFYSDTFCDERRDHQKLCATGDFRNDLGVLASMPEVKESLFVHDDLFCYYAVGGPGKMPDLQNSLKREEIESEVNHCHTMWRTKIQRKGRHHHHHHHLHRPHHDDKKAKEDEAPKEQKEVFYKYTGKKKIPPIPNPNAPPGEPPDMLASINGGPARFKKTALNSSLDSDLPVGFRRSSVHEDWK